MRVVHLADYGGPYSGSFVPMMRAVLNSARCHGFDVALVLSGSARGRRWLTDLERDAIPYHLVESRSRHELRRVVAEVAGAGPCVLHTHFSLFDLPCAALARSHSELAVFWHVHLSLKPGLPAWARSSVRFGLLGRGVEEIFCVSPDLPRAVRLRLGPAERVSFLPNAIDTERFAPADPQHRRAARQRLGVDGDAPVLLHFGWDWEFKGGPLFLQSAKRLPQVIAATVGGGEQARRCAKELGIEERVRVVEPMEQVEELYAAADLVVLSSPAEGMPFAMAEALACGRPVVASDLPGQRWIGGGLDACRLTSLDHREMARAIAALLSRDDEVAAVEAQRARDWIRANMDLRPWVGRMLQRYEAAMARRR